MSVADYRTEPFAGVWDDPLADPPDFGQPDDITDVCAHGVDLMTGDCGSCEGPVVEPLAIQPESPEATAQRCSCWESPRHHVCQCSCHDVGGEQ